MRVLVLPVVLGVAGCLAVACGPGATAPSSTTPSTQERLTLKLETAHFRVLADRTDPATLHATADALEAAYPRVTTDLGVTSLPVVSASVWQDSASFYDAMRITLGQVYTGSSGYVTGGQGLCLLAGSSVTTSASHEFAHVVSLAVNPTFANNPRWLWETVALYENRQFIDPATLDFMQAGRFPTIAALDLDFNSSRQVYQVGYVLGEFIVEAWGMDGLLRLVRANGQIPATFGIPVSGFEQRWYAFLQSKYHLLPPAA